eukprot:TRINITY_DN4781_c0_g1_i1.p1 TRINITY_DN4781_c0_g1~~TRINITY_DN4781_c0_g1_i1.p1  ORF type:complete len:315 (+),score=38.58 TRINITY_DN4781_c0_g1_i1:50-946(+)
MEIVRLAPHVSNEVKQWFQYRAIRLALSVAAVVMVTALVSSIFYAQSYSYLVEFAPVDRDSCSCTCWDGVFKGSYGRGGYKQIYFNMDLDTTVLLGWTIVYSVLAYILADTFLRLLWNGKMRWDRGLVVVSGLHGNFYGYFAIFNYINDHMYHLFWSQLFYTFTELVVGVCAYQLMKVPIDAPPAGAGLRATKPSHNVPERSLMWIMLVISVIHIIRGSLDQFVVNILLGHGQLHMVLRDILFLFGDFVVLFWCSWSLWQVHRRAGTEGLLFKKHAPFAVVVIVASLVGLHFLPTIGL